MQFQNDRHPWNVRALLESTATPFTLADYGPRAAIFRQGDPCDSVMHIERGRVWLAVTARSGNLTEQLLYSSEQRLAHLLLVLGNCDARRPRRCALPDLPQALIAEMVGTTRSRVNAFMGKFKKLGFIEELSGLLHVTPAGRVWGASGRSAGQ